MSNALQTRPTDPAADPGLDRPISLEEAMELTGHRDTGTLRQHARSGKLRAQKLGRGERSTWYTTRRDVQDYLALLQEEERARAPRWPRGLPREAEAALG